MNSNDPIATFKLVIVGDGGVGKTTFVKRHITGEFQKPYIPTNGADVTSIDFSTNIGIIRFVIWDTAGQDKFGSLRKRLYIDAHCFIIMFDLTSISTYKSVEMWHKDLIKISDNIPIVLVGNKADVKDRELKEGQINFHMKHNLKYYEVSAKSKYQHEEPFLWLLKQLTKDSKLYLVESPLIHPAEIMMDPEHIAQLQHVIDEANKNGTANLLDEDDF